MVMPLPMVSVTGLLPSSPRAYSLLDVLLPKVTVPPPASVWLPFTKYSTPKVPPPAAPRLAAPLRVRPPAT